MKRTKYGVWYKTKGTTPIMPSAVFSTTKKERDKWIKTISEDDRLEIVSVTEDVINVYKRK